MLGLVILSSAKFPLRAGQDKALASTSFYFLMCACIGVETRNTWDQGRSITYLAVKFILIRTVYAGDTVIRCGLNRSLHLVLLLIVIPRFLFVKQQTLHVGASNVLNQVMFLQTSLLAKQPRQCSTYRVSSPQTVNKIPSPPYLPHTDRNSATTRGTQLGLDTGPRIRLRRIFSTLGSVVWLVTDRDWTYGR